MDATTLLVAILGAGGIGALIKTVFDVIIKARSGVAIRDSKRRADIQQQLLEALAREDEQRDRAEAAERNVRRLQDTISVYRRAMIEEGHKPESLPAWPRLEDTLTRAEVNKLTKGNT